jgi:uncharacterized Fe-S cluster-containing radical SAM superfamily protein
VTQAALATKKVAANAYLPRLAEGYVRGELGLQELLTFFDSYQHLYTVGVDVNAICNLACDYCYLDAYNRSTAPNYIELERLEVFLSGCAAEGVDLIALVGKEPFADNRGVHLLQFLDSLSHHGERFRFGVVTNGTLVERVIELLPRSVAYVDVSLDGSEAINDRVRGKDVFRRAIRGINALVARGVEVWISAVMHTDNWTEPVLQEFVSSVVRETGCGRFYFSPVRNFTGGLYPFLLSYAQIAAAQQALVDISHTERGVERMILDHPYEAVWRDYFWPVLDGNPSRLSALTVDAFGNVLEQVGERAFKKLDVFPHGPWATCRIDARGEYLADVEARTYAHPESVGNIAESSPPLLHRRAMSHHLEPMMRRFLANMQRGRRARAETVALTSVSMPREPAAALPPQARLGY